MAVPCAHMCRAFIARTLTEEAVAISQVGWAVVRTMADIQAEKVRQVFTLVV